MTQARPCGRGWSRRTFLAHCSLLRLPAASEKGRVFPSETRRYLDPTTEFVVFRFTDPAHASFLPDSGGRPVSARGNFLLYASDRTGSAQAYRMDLKSGQSWLITEAAALEPSWLVLFTDDRHIAYFDGRTLFRTSLRITKRAACTRFLPDLNEATGRPSAPTVAARSLSRWPGTARGCG